MTHWPDVVIEAYERIVENAKEGKGVHLSAEEVKALSQDPAVYLAVQHASLDDRPEEER